MLEVILVLIGVIILFVGNLVGILGTQRLFAKFTYESAKKHSDKLFWIITAVTVFMMVLLFFESCEYGEGTCLFGF